MPKAEKPTSSNSRRVGARDVYIYQRPNTSAWWTRQKRPDGTWVRASTGCSDEGAATERALEMHREAQFRHKFGLTESTKSFKDAAAALIESLEVKVARGERDKRYATLASRFLQRYPSSYFGDKPIDEITVAELHSYAAWRESYWTTGPGVGERQEVTVRGKTVTRRTHHGSKPTSGEWSWISMVFDMAVAKGWLTPERRPAIKKPHVKTRRRPAFTDADLKKLEDAAPEWLRDGKGGSFFRTRFLCICFYYALLTSGLRTGEAMSLKWKHLQEATIQGKTVRYLYISKGKTGDRQCVPLEQFFDAIEEVRQVNPFQGPEDFIFCVPDHEGKPDQPDMARSFLRWLEFAEVTHHVGGDAYTLYALRHTYATKRLSEGGLSTHVVARNMGTSTPMLDKHYSHITALLAADDLVRINAKSRNEDGML